MVLSASGACCGVERQSSRNLLLDVPHTWIKRYRQNSTQPFVGSGHVKPEDAKLKLLQRENQELREEVEILKKAAAYFAKNQK